MRGIDGCLSIAWGSVGNAVLLCPQIGIPRHPIGLRGKDLWLEQKTRNIWRIKKLSHWLPFTSF